jgi:nitroreductase
MRCGHCVALCPQHAIEVDSLDAESFAPVEALGFDAEQLLKLLKQRRSIRDYKDKPVPRSVIDRIIEAVASAPTGTGRPATGIIVIDDPDKLTSLSEFIYGLYESLEEGLSHPIGGIIVRRKVKRYAGEKNLRALGDFVMPGMHWYIRWYREGSSDEITRDCPALMLFHNPIAEPMGEANCIIAAFQAVLMAHVMGIGTCFNDLIPMACNSPRVPEIRALLDLPEDREVYASITMGYPKYTFRRIPSRDLAEVRYLE